MDSFEFETIAFRRVLNRCYVIHNNEKDQDLTEVLGKASIDGWEFLSMLDSNILLLRRRIEVDPDRTT